MEDTYKLSQLTLDVGIKDGGHRSVVSSKGFSGLIRHDVKFVLHSFNTGCVSVSFHDLFVGESPAGGGDAEAGEEEGVDWLSKE